jgi:hypothetical protein
MKDFRKISDKELDDLFIESASNSLPEFEESAWDKMESLLDDSDNDKGGGVFKKPLIYGSIILLMLSLAYFSKDNWYSTISLDNSNSTESQDIVALRSKGKSPIDTTANAKLKKGGIEVSKTDKIPTNQGYKLIAKAETRKINNETDYNKNVELDGTNLNNSKDKKIKNGFIPIKNVLQNMELSRDNSSINSVLLNANEVSETNEGEDINNSNLGVASSVNEFELGGFGNENYQKVGLKTSVLQEKINLISLKSFVPFDSEFQYPILMAPEKIVVVNEQIEVDKWGLRLAISPDISIVPENAFFKIGHNWAAIIEYRFNERWVIQTGVIKSLKFYNANPEQYLWPERWGSRPVELNQIDARCNMLDIPVNIRYNISTGKNRWFAQTGFTNYFMLNERYDYVFANNYTNVTWESWEGKTGFYGAAVANFSFGLEKKFSKRLTFQAEPFMKVPLANVGFGKVKLLTTGLFISSKYSLFK